MAEGVRTKSEESGHMGSWFCYALFILHFGRMQLEIGGR